MTKEENQADLVKLRGDLIHLHLLLVRHVSALGYLYTSVQHNYDNLPDKTTEEATLAVDRLNAIESALNLLESHKWLREATNYLRESEGHTPCPNTN